MQLKRFWDKVNKNGTNGCWIWTGAGRGTGYGAFKYNEKVYDAHRFVLEILSKTPIPKEKVACHRCDNRRCVNPDHLYLGTPKTNYDDMIRRNRDNFAKGEQAGGSKLTSIQVKEIRKKYIPFKYPLNKLAKEYNVSKKNIFDIVHGKIWKHI